DRCGGSFRYTANGVKDCTHCLRPHVRENYGKILEKMPEILELAKKKREEACP
ncbi:MAG: cysteine-rich small domain-containing protein, partial [Oscillospiraceae bacterium]